MLQTQWLAQTPGLHQTDNVQTQREIERNRDREREGWEREREREMQATKKKTARRTWNK